MKPIHPWTGEAHIPVFSASLFVFALKWTPINLRVSCGWEVVCESVFYLCHHSALIYKLPAQPGCLTTAMCIGTRHARTLLQRGSSATELCRHSLWHLTKERARETLYSWNGLASLEEYLKSYLFSWVFFLPGRLFSLVLFTHEKGKRNKCHRGRTWRSTCNLAKTVWVLNPSTAGIIIFTKRHIQDNTPSSIFLYFVPPGY